jgi:hypothetical protein
VNSSASKAKENAKTDNRKSKAGAIQPRWLKLIDNGVKVDEAFEIPGYIMIC